MARSPTRRSQQALTDSRARGLDRVELHRQPKQGRKAQRDERIARQFEAAARQELGPAGGAAASRIRSSAPSSARAAGCSAGPGCTRQRAPLIPSAKRAGGRPDGSRIDSSSVASMPAAASASKRRAIARGSTRRHDPVGAAAALQPGQPVAARAITTADAPSLRPDLRTASARRRWRPCGRSVSTSRAGSSRRRSHNPDGPRHSWKSIERRSRARISQNAGCSITSIPGRAPSRPATASPSALLAITIPT